MGEAASLLIVCGILAVVGGALCMRTRRQLQREGRRPKLSRDFHLWQYYTLAPVLLYGGLGALAVGVVLWVATQLGG